MNQTAFYTEPAREIPVRRTDVFVAGAGTAGCIAAIAAARTGASVVLVEKLPVPGGTLTNGGIGVSSFFSEEEDPKKAVRVVGGLPHELIERLQQSGGATEFAPTPNNPQRNTWRVVAEHENYKGVISEMLMEAGVKVLLNTMLCGVAAEGDTIRGVIVQNRSGRYLYEAASFIDATGDGDLARLAGADQLDMSQGKECPTGMVFGFGGVDWKRVMEENPAGSFVQMSAQEPNAYGLACNQYLFLPAQHPELFGKMESLKGIWLLSMQSNHGQDATYINLSRGEILDGTDAEAVSAAELRVRARINHILADFRAYVPGFEHAYLAWESVQLGIRISKITVCDHSVSQDEIHAAARFEDEIGLYAFHDLAAHAAENIAIAEPGYYGFPYRMLLPVGIKNLFMAGRCVTEEYEAHMSTRNTVGCMIMGQGAGAAAALCAKRGCESRDLPYEELRGELLKQNVILDI